MSRNKLPTIAGKWEIIEIASVNGICLTCKFQAVHKCKGAGGRKVADSKQLPELYKTGPDTWCVFVEVSVGYTLL